MARPENRLVVLHNDNAVFTDRSDASYDFGRGSYLFEYSNTDSDELYVGFEKPINKFYVEVATANTNTSVATAQYYNGTAFTDLDGFTDESLGLTRSGFFKWRRDQTDEAKTTINSEEFYWYKVTFDADFSVGTIVQGLNIVFSDDNDLKEEYFEILEFLSSGEASFVLKHQSTRREIVQFLRNRGNIKSKNDNPVNTGGNRIKNITEWDLLDSDEARQASKFLALGKIFKNQSDNIDDKWFQLASQFTAKGNDILSGLFISLDLDDDGKTDNRERLRQTGVVRVTRI